jgi:hypothetical protein
MTCYLPENYFSSEDENETNFDWYTILKEKGADGLLQELKRDYQNFEFLKPYSETYAFMHEMALNAYLPLLQFVIDNANESIKKYLEICVPFAAELGNVQLLQFLRQNNIRICYTAIFNASTMGNVEIVKDIFENELKGAIIMEMDENILVRNSISSKSLHLVHFLLSKGIFRLDVLNRLSDTALLLGRQPNLEIVKIAVQVGFRNEHTILLAAISSNHIQIVKYIVSTFELDLNSEFGSEALSKACMNVNDIWRIVHFLITKGCDPKKLSDRVIRQCDWCFKYDTLYVLYSQGVVKISTLSRMAQAYIEKRKCVENEAARKIYFWWIPICYDLKRECGQRMMNKILNRIEQHEANFYGN